ncbi:polyphosphate kinase [Phascolarctobacterium succinatutens CAG:287]|uniref:Polyphosphate kinase n=1 Tax=Phascolarctobacterium succinatutens CAG:287 TaxID=1263101 RepID=R6WU33_9FIRM|nr:RNA degradosome polyphosphate kinase [Phascolarctobacterium succinatutens]MBS5427173.1 RNA degradosome polyphosphate kinase [Phascolarctobacterium succinatutens]CDD12860.1 polyphosphate kinase [Phascolarctobacterium succinatutens CAG:287]
MGKLDLTKPEYFYNRELSWLKFNLRVLKEAMVKETPLLERLKFIAISASNLDEFFMVRVASLWSNFDSGVEKRDASGMSVHEQLVAISQAAHEQVRTQTKSLIALMAEMDAVKLHFRRVKDLSELGKDWLEEYYREVVFPVLTPMAVDASRPFPFLANKTLNLAVELIKVDGEHSMGLIQVPSVLDRIVEVEPEGKRTFVFLEDIIASHCHDLFKGCHILDMVSFRVTRDSDLDLEEDDSVDLMKEVEESLRKRKRGAAVRLEIFKTNNNRIKKFLEENLDVTEMEVYEINGPLDPTCFFKFIGMKGMWPWLYEPFVPQRPLELPDDSDLFAAIRENDILLHHPYESFDPVVKLVSDAADDPQVLAIKQTLYRVSGNSPIVAALARAAENGKQVTVLVELKARFDEENNILWARRLEKAGCHVIYGLVGLKTHAKIILIVRKEDNGIRRYLHLGTGNYNDSTAKLYTDLGLMTANDEFGSDASAFFNLLSGYSEPPVWNKLVMAPLGLREKIYALIDNEIAMVRAGREGHIIAKMNSLIDQPVIQKLYEASAAGVHIDLIVRGICGLRTGIEGISDNITVRSIVGRQLEHSRIFWFANGGEEQLYLSSADWMPRNLNDRVELFFPVETEEHIHRIKALLDLYLRDNVGAHMMQSNGTYRRVRNKLEPVSAQSTLYEMAQLAVTADKLPMEKRLQPVFSRR